MSTGKFSNRLAIYTLLAIHSIALVTAGSAAVSIQTIALEGDPVVGAQPGMQFTSFAVYPSINSQGQVMFKGTYAMAGDESVTGEGYWSAVPGSLNALVFDSDQPPGSETGSTYTNMSRLPASDDNGQFAFFSSVSSVDGLDDFSGVWSDASGTLSLVARSGSEAPGTVAGIQFTSFINSYGAAMMNGSGQLIFIARLIGDGVDDTNDEGLWMQDQSGQLQLIARNGDQASGLDPGVYYKDVSALGNSSFTINDTGTATFNGLIAGPGIDETNERCIWSGTPGNINLLMRAGQPAPGTEPGVVFDGFVDAEVNANQELAVFGYLSGPGIDIFTNGTGIWSGTPGSMQLIAKAGEHAPGMDETAVFERILKMDQNSQGQITIVSTTSGTDENVTYGSGIWSYANGELNLVVKEADHAPGTEEGVVFDFNNMWGPVTNSSGQMVIRANLTGPGVDASNNIGIWIAQPNGELELIVRKGQQIDVNDDPNIEDLRTVGYVDQLFFGIDGTDNGSPASFSDCGDNVFALYFDDGTHGIFLADTRMPGDMNYDGFVGLDDLDIVLINWNQTVTPWDLSAGDATGDGYVGLDDLDLILGNWNAGTPPSSDGTSIPEPAGLVIALAMFSVTMMRRY